MQELWPRPSTDIDIASRLRADERPAPAGRPWVTMVMISSFDGGVAVEGRSGGLGGPADQRRFVALRNLADAIVVGSTTADVEDYKPSATPIAVLSQSLSLRPDARLFRDPSRRPLVYTTGQALRAHGRSFDGTAEIIDLGDSVAPAAVLSDLARRNVRHVALEGGPTINGAFLSADLVDEALLTFSPLAVSGSSPRIVAGPELVPPSRFSVDRVSIADDLVFVRYLRTDSSPRPSSSVH